MEGPPNQPTGEQPAGRLARRPWWPSPRRCHSETCAGFPEHATAWAGREDGAGFRGKQEWVPFTDAGDSFLFHASLQQYGPTVDPMSEEATFLRGQQDHGREKVLQGVHCPRLEAESGSQGSECPIGHRATVEQQAIDTMLLEAMGDMRIVTKEKIQRQGENTGQDTLSENVVCAEGDIVRPGTVTNQALVSVEPHSASVLDEPVLREVENTRGTETNQQGSQNVKAQKKLLFAKVLPAPLMSSAEQMPSPKPQAKTAQGKTTATPVSRKSARIASRGTPALTMEEHATALLMKKSGFLEQGKKADPGLSEKFIEQFVHPLEQKLVGDFREAFGLPTGMEADELSALAIDADA